MAEAQRPAPLRDRRWYRVVRPVFIALGLAFLILAIARSWADVRDGSQELASPATVVAMALALVGVVLVAQAWTVLFDVGERTGGLRAAYYRALVGKYIPGGVFQAMGQVATTHEEGVPLRTATAAYPASVLVTIAAGSAVASLLVLFSAAPGLVRIAAALSLCTIVVLHRRTLPAFLAVLERIARRRIEASVLPPPRRLFPAWVLTVAGFLASGGSFALIASQYASVPLVYATAAYSLGWLAGFLVVPLPAGVGVREAVLASALAPFAGVGVVVAASVAHRLVTLLAEALALAGGGRRAATVREPS